MIDGIKKTLKGLRIIGINIALFASIAIFLFSHILVLDALMNNSYPMYRLISLAIVLLGWGYIIGSNCEW